MTSGALDWRWAPLPEAVSVRGAARVGAPRRAIGPRKPRARDVVDVPRGYRAPSAALARRNLRSRRHPRHPRKGRKFPDDNGASRVFSRNSPWLPRTCRDGLVGTQNFSREGPEVPCRVFYRTFFVGRHPRKVSRRFPGGPGELRLAPFGSVGLRLARLESLTRVFGFNFSQSGSPG